MNSTTNDSPDSSSSSLQSSDTDTLVLYADPVTKLLKIYDDSDLQPVANLGVIELDSLVTESFFQDNTLIFEKLLDQKFVMCVYPPGSGKSTIAQLLKYYLSKNGVPEQIKKYLDGCEFQRAENAHLDTDPEYRMMRNSGSVVLYMDFSQVQGNSLSSVIHSYSLYLRECWANSHLPLRDLNYEANLLRSDSSSVWTSLSRLRSNLRLRFKGNIYIILDSLDNIYNLIASLQTADSKTLYSKFTKDISILIGKGDPMMKIFGFGVSPYLVKEFQNRTVYFIGSDEKIRKFFSFSDTSISKVIEAWDLGISLEQCKSVAQFKYNNASLVNPYLAVSYLKSLSDKKPFVVNISPKSLWMSSIFKEDLEILLDVLTGEWECNFNMSVTMRSMCTIPESQKRRNLYYPLFVFGGFLSCAKVQNNKYSLTVSNQSAKILLKYHLDLLSCNKFKITVPETNDLVTDFINGKLEEFCVKLSKALLKLSSLISKDEMKYHLFVAGIFHRLEERGYSTDNDKDYGAIRPDAVYHKSARVIVMEYKHIKLPPKTKTKRARVSTNCTIKSQIVNATKGMITKCCEEQVTKYAGVIASKYGKNVEINVILFYLNHVILLRSTYFIKNSKYSPYKIFTSNSFFSKRDLPSIKASD